MSAGDEIVQPGETYKHAAGALTLLKIPVRVQRISYEAQDINSYEFVSPSGAPLPRFTAGAHIDVQVPGGFMRQYSLCNPPHETHRYKVAVLNAIGGRGGSKSFHANVRAGDILNISHPKNHFELFEGASKYLLIAGGIGITPLMAMLARLTALNADLLLHYCSRSIEKAAFANDLLPLQADGRVIFHYDGGTPERGLNILELLREPVPGAHVFCCGPRALMAAARAATAHWPAGTVHFEFFAPAALSPAIDQGAADCEIKIASTGATFPVPPDKTILEVLRANGVDVEASCESGTCGTCRTRYLSGDVEHRDYFLMDDEQQEFIMICVSRPKCGQVVLDL